MALVRILVDGYSLLHAWPELAEGHARYSETARNELVRFLGLYQDASGTPISVFFDGIGPKRGRLKEASGSTTGVEVLYSRSGQTADQMIERVTHRMRSFGEVLVVTDDFAERDTVIALGGMASNCHNFMETMHLALTEQQKDIARINRRERSRFKLPSEE